MLPGMSVEIRDRDRREIVGMLVPYNRTITVRGRPESFAKGAFDAINPIEARLLRGHNENSPIGRMLELEERDDGAYGVFRVAPTPSGDEALILAEEGVVDALSIGFVPGTRTREGVHTRIAELPEVSLVLKGAYPEARVMEVRMDDNTATDTITDLPNGDNEPAVKEKRDRRPDIEARFAELDEAVDSLTARLAKVAQTRNEEQETVTITPFEWFIAELRAEVRKDESGRIELQKRWENMQHRALSDVTGTVGGSLDASGLTAEQYVAGQLVHVLDARRPFFRNAGSFPAPKGGSARFPIVSQNTLVASRPVQKAEANSRSLIVDTVLFEADWFDGAVDVALELIQMGEIGVLGMVWEDLLGQYAIVTEDDAIAKTEAAAVTDAAALPTDTYGNFAAAVATQAIAVREATGVAATRLAIDYDTWPTIVSMVDASDRRQFTSGDYSDGTVSLTAESFTLAGGILVYAARVTNPLLYNQTALRVHDYGPTRVEALNVTLMGRDIGLLGRTLVVPRIPAGIVSFGTLV